jgi:hypothetical protein
MARSNSERGAKQQASRNISFGAIALHWEFNAIHSQAAFCQ